VQGGRAVYGAEDVTARCTPPGANKQSGPTVSVRSRVSIADDGDVVTFEGTVEAADGECPVDGDEAVTVVDDILDGVVVRVGAVLARLQRHRRLRLRD
jgi:hypothetical protein